MSTFHHSLIATFMVLILSMLSFNSKADDKKPSSQSAITDWKGAQWIAMEQDKKYEYILNGLPYESRIKRAFGDKKIGFFKLPEFRREFTLEKRVKKATAYVCGLGQFELYLNGGKVGDHFLDPGWTKFDKQSLYVTFDVTSMLKKGSNAIGAMLGNGFFNMPRARYFKLFQSYGAPRLVMLLTIEYKDGTVENIVTDKDWKVSQSPITFSSTYGGEDYDANLYQEGWNEPGFNDSSWSSPVVLGPVTPGSRPTDFAAGVWNPQLVPQEYDPIKVVEIFPAKKYYRNSEGWLYDLGENFAGIVRIKGRAEKSSPIKMEPSELMTADTMLYRNVSYSPSYYSYTPKAGTTSEWQPRFSYWGFRYVLVSGAVPEGEANPDGLPVIEQLDGLFTTNSAKMVGTFDCSNDLFNRINKLIIRAERSNMVSILTDCPHREKLGWLEQDHLMQFSLLYNFDLYRLYSKIMEDIKLAQTPEGIVPCIAPEYIRFSGGFADTPEWGSTFIISPWYMYLWYGDDTMIKNNYPEMRRYLDYLSSRAVDGIVAYGLGDWYDLGPKGPGGAQLTSNAVSATAMYYYDICLMSKMAKLLGKDSEVTELNTLAGRVKDSFNRKCSDPKTNKYERNSQTANAMALFMGLTTEDSKQAALDNLIADIKSRGNALTAGDIGYRYVVQALQQAGRQDVIYDINSNTSVPGYGWMLNHGATALTESWQAMADKSNNHFMMGHLQEWLYGGLGGIRPDESGTPETVGWKHFTIAPQPCGNITYCNVSYDSVRGKIVSKWKISDNTFLLEVIIPKNTTATVVLPGQKAKEVGAGKHSFSVKMQ